MPRGRGKRWLLGAALGAAVLATWVVVRNVPESLPETVWSHPGDPWCDRCKAGVPNWVFGLHAGDNSWDPDGCFTGLDGEMELGAPQTPLLALVENVERGFRLGERGYYGPRARYVRTGRIVAVDGHAWTEYRKAP